MGINTESTKLLEKDVETLGNIFNIDHNKALENIKNLPKKMPWEAEILVAVPSLEAFGKMYFPEENNQGLLYCKAIQLVLEKGVALGLFDRKSFEDFSFSPNNLKTSIRTKQARTLLYQKQQSDILVFPAQLGERWKNTGIYRIRSDAMDGNSEFCLGVFEILSILLNVSLNKGSINCAGDLFDGDWRYMFRTEKIGNFNEIISICRGNQQSGKLFPITTSSRDGEGTASGFIYWEGDHRLKFGL